MSCIIIYIYNYIYYIYNYINTSWSAKMNFTWQSQHGDWSLNKIIYCTSMSLFFDNLILLCFLLRSFFRSGLEYFLFIISYGLLFFTQWNSSIHVEHCWRALIREYPATPIGDLSCFCREWIPGSPTVIFQLSRRRN